MTQYNITHEHNGNAHTNEQEEKPYEIRYCCQGRQPARSQRGDPGTRTGLATFPSSRWAMRMSVSRLPTAPSAAPIPTLWRNIFRLGSPLRPGPRALRRHRGGGTQGQKKGLKVGDRVAGNFLHFCGTCYYCRNGQEQFCENCDETNYPGMSETIVWHESQVFKLARDVSLKNRLPAGSPSPSPPASWTRLR